MKDDSDLDTGVDDALAISYALKPEIELIGASPVLYGNVLVERCATHWP